MLSELKKLKFKKKAIQDQVPLTWIRVRITVTVTCCHAIAASVVALDDYQ